MRPVFPSLYWAALPLISCWACLTMFAHLFGGATTFDPVYPAASEVQPGQHILGGSEWSLLEKTISDIEKEVPGSTSRILFIRCELANLASVHSPFIP